jgi:histone deacetylase 11
MIVYHDAYNFDLDDLLGNWDMYMGVGLTSPYDTQRYRTIHQFLRSQGCETYFTQPQPITEDILRLVHPESYLNTLHHSEELARIYESPILSRIPYEQIKRYVINSVFLAIGGTILATQIAMREGWAINLSGGYHHAKTEEGRGSCPYSDIGVTIRKIWEDQPYTKIMIVDLDAHQGNGYAEIFLHEHRVSIFDVYNENKYPIMFVEDVVLRDRINFNHPVQSGIDDATYMGILHQHLPGAVTDIRPDLIIYNAGYDTIETDPYGGMKLTPNGICQRDEYVFKIAKQNKVPIVMLISGGYSSEGTATAGKSILNIIKNKEGKKECCIM